jgi:hypothetical protein
MKKNLLYLPLMAALLMPGWAWTEDHDHEGEDVDVEIETVERDVMSYVRSVEPRAVAPMKAWAEDDKEAYIDTLMEIYGSLEEIKELREEAPVFADLYHRILETELKMEYLGHAIQEAESAGDRIKLEEELKRILPEAFDLRMKESEMELAELRAEMTEVEAEWKKRQANKDKIIERRFNELTGKDEDLDW